MQGAMECGPLTVLCTVSGHLLLLLQLPLLPLLLPKQSKS
jgi:hypothetical protein